MEMFASEGSTQQRTGVHLKVYKMGRNRGRMTEMILSLTLEIIYLLTGKEYGPVKSTENGIPKSELQGSEGQERTLSPMMISPPSLIHERNNDEKILDLTNKIIELLTGEELDYIENHNDFCKEVKVEEFQTFQSMDVSSKRSAPEICASPHRQHQVQKKSVDCDSPLEYKWENPVDVNVYAVSQSEHALMMCLKVKTENTNQDGSSDADSPTAITQSLIPSKYKECDLLDYTENHINIVKYDSESISENETLAKIKVEEVPLNIIEAKNNENPFEVINNETILSFEEDRNVRLQSSGLNHPSYLNNSLDIAQITDNASGGKVICIDTEDLCPEKAKLISHQKTHAGKKPFVCCECGKGFTRNTILVEHMRLHTGEKPYVCSKCGQRFISNGQRIRHERLHSGEKPYVCTECGKGFTRNTILVEHKRIHTGEKPFSCLECGKLFATNSQLVKHIKYHRGEKPHECLDCGKRFISNGLLVIHQRIHTGEKPFVCPDCGKAFARNAILQEHMRIHSGIKPFVCKECGKRFASNSHLAKHQRNHLGKKPHACPDCGKRFICNALLIIHYRSHTGEKPFVCMECGKCFAKKGSLVSHSRIHTGGKLSRFYPGV